MTTLINDLQGQTKAFAEACYDMNSIEELESALSLDSADAKDCETWEISDEEWRKAIEAALNEKKQ